VQDLALGLVEPHEVHTSLTENGTFYPPVMSLLKWQNRVLVCQRLGGPLGSSTVVAALVLPMKLCRCQWLLHGWDIPCVAHRNPGIRPQRLTG